ncbi:triosephosphate isomerase [Actinobaculum suis]|uniref:Triosephosphate isomerase n=1 Tax=Actinobaculum suis TaxID=1657 RepID=A0A7Z8YA91_9ACTO|nr:triose-phosphate isomerase [Actinobaculum suis]VDG77174.1 triosephosphate isomerase [Actinobaculum suis]
MVWVGTSWKMNGTLSFAREYAESLAGAGMETYVRAEVQPFVIPPFTALNTAAKALAETPVLVGAQNAHWEDAGAWTGEVSVPQAADAGARIIEMGHSERREWFGETDETVNLKAKAALRHGLVPLICFGEPAEVFEAGETLPFICSQIDAALAGLPAAGEGETGPRVLLAYEPIWAIGEHGRPPAREDLVTTFAALAERYGERVTAILYGGSVNHANNQDILSIPGVGGLFIGRSAWTAEGYLKNLELAREYQEQRG